MTFEELEEELEIERMRVVACGCAALANTKKTIKERINKDNPYWTASYKDVCSIVDREIKYRNALEDIAEGECNYNDKLSHIWQ